MRVFISWSGERSHSVAIALKTFIGDIIQSVTPFVSDEDIVSGERWNSRIQEELQENQYGILSITHDNKESPWLLFEAGALSNSSYNIPVVPFLFDIEPSELTGSPLLQFQATIYYNRENARKLINDINNACNENKLDDTRLARAFERCYSEFESALKQVKLESGEPIAAESDKTHAILEELLDLTRGNQKLLSSDNQNIMIERLEMLADKSDMRLNGNGVVRWRSGKRKIHPMMFEELSHLNHHKHMFGYSLLIVLSIYRENLPWLYDAGRDLINTIKSDVALSKKQHSCSEFKELLEFTFHNSIFSIGGDKEEHIMLHEFSEYFNRYLRESEVLSEKRKP